MEKMPEKNAWIYVIIQDPGAAEQFVGFMDETRQKPYIPAFKTKEEAQNALIHFSLARDKKYEIQAVIFAELAKDALQNDFLIYLLDGDGKILHPVDPDSI